MHVKLGVWPNGALLASFALDSTMLGPASGGLPKPTSCVLSAFNSDVSWMLWLH